MTYLFKIKWINGPLTGREMALPEGATRIGGDDADIALVLEQGAETSLAVTPEGILITPPVAVWVEGLPWDPAEYLPLQRVIDLAGQLLVVCRYADTPLTLPVTARKPAAGRQNKRRWWAIVAGSAALLTSAIASLTIYLTLHSPPPDTLQPAAWLTQQVASPALAGLAVRSDPDGIIHLSGVAAEEQPVRQLINDLRERNLTFYNDSTSSEMLRSRVRQVLEMYGYPDVEITAGTTRDSVIIYGNIQYTDNWVQASRDLAAIKALGGWQVINDRAELFQKLLARFEENRLLEGLNITASRKGFLIHGQFSSDISQRIIRTVATFNQQEQSRLKARYNNMPVTVAVKMVLPADIVSVGGRKDATWLQLANNMRLYKGTTLSNGYKVYAISQNWLLLLRNQQFVSVPVNL